jgi:hypothetical protein
MVPPGTPARLPEGRGRALDNVGHGTVLTGRYRLEERLRTRSASPAWRALDETLERPVRVTLLDPKQPQTADILDAARRVTLAKDHRLAQVLDVGRDGGAAFVVVEDLPGRTLAQAITSAPLPATEARRLIGEVAEALSGAADRGLHHQRLSPEALVVGTDGSIKLTGTAVEAAAVGAESRDSAVACRVDALGLVCVLYAALTGRWPGTTPSDLPAAPWVEGRPVAPGDLVAGVPADLDDLCTRTLGNEQDAPVSPAEVAQRLAPWPGAHPLTDPRGLLVTTPARPASTSTGAPLASVATAAGGSAPSRTGASRTGVAGSLFTPGPKTVDPDILPPGSFRGWSDLSTIGVPVAEEEPLVPFAPTLSGEKPADDQTRFVLRVVVGFVLLVLVVAAVSLRTLGSPTDLILKDTAKPIPVVPATTPSPGPASPTPTPTPTVTATPSAVATPSASPQIVGVQAIDPQGDGSENNNQTVRAVDGDSSTKWKSNHYAGADFGGLKKGVGLVLNLGGGTVPDVQQVIVEAAGNGGTVELRTTPGPGLDDSKVVAQASIEGGRAVLTPSKPVNSRLLLLWFTKLPKTGGEYQLLVSEINVR